MNGVIEGYVGPEGSGKTMVMTFHLLRCADYGLKVLTFPGYVVKRRTGSIYRQVSEEIKPMDFLRNFQSMQGIALGITEITNYGIDAYAFNGILPRIFGYAAAMRRKLGLVILYDVQNFGMIPPRIRFYTHTLMFCRDLYHGHQYDENPFERGTNILTRRMDMKGFYTGKEGWLGRPRVLNHADSLWDCYDTTQKVDLKWGLMKYKKEDIMSDDSATPDGLEISQINGDTKAFIKNNLQGLPPGAYRLSTQERDELIGMFVDQIREESISELPSEIVKEKISMLGIDMAPERLGRVLKGFGVRYKYSPSGSVYQFS